MNEFPRTVFVFPLSDVTPEFSVMDDVLGGGWRVVDVGRSDLLLISIIISSALSS